MSNSSEYATNACLGQSLTFNFFREILKYDDWQFEEVIGFAAKHNKLELLNYAAPRMAIRLSLTESVALISCNSDLLHRWVRLSPL
jgi:predicted nucleic acid-binding protein